ncbi:O-antigen ligase like membrane protein [Alkalibacterium gilvum]|uniref:O-antigen ligase like membrane protein n=1 Tax=Alkalibacterium gilvum TaxID=1130080 RepID=A0A1H6TFF3_9LACT|nr:O-antigen ligase family protein [Alkalibacterium gilvum]SEI76904.1 O-antigen ligase like membrane protein [Alkalibacterium gilvum]
MNIYNIKLNSNIINRIFMLLFVTLSFVNSTGLLLFLFFIIVSSIQGSNESIKSIVIVTLRSVINPELAPSMSQYEYLKWIVLFTCAAILVKNYFKIKDRSPLNKFIIPIMYYLIYSSVSSFLFSTLPLVALMKIFSYGFVFIGILIGVYKTSPKLDWIAWLHRIFSPIVLGSIVLYILGLGYHPTNLRLFRGVINHPNILGTTMVLFIALNMTILQLKDYKSPFIYHLFIVLSFIIIWWSKARTSFIAASILIIIYLFLININLLKKVFIINLFLIVVISILFSYPEITELLYDFLSKGTGGLLDSVTASRGNQIGNLINNFKSNPLFGTGFAVPVLTNRSFVISTEYIVEPGNLFFAVLGYGGIVGGIIFSFFFLNILWKKWEYFKVWIFLPLATVLVSMGEMVFFSTNNMGPILYLYLAIYVFYDLKYNEKNT